jgi:histidinol phosphatase-like PHP family hydrolase
MSIDEVLAQPVGARFHRADLHIHSFGASHDVRDATMTPEGIVSTAIQEGLGLIAITDHNEVGNVEAAVAAAEGTDLLVVPGVELSTSQGHLLCYLPTVEALVRFYGQLAIVDRGLPTSRCQQSLLECLNLLAGLAGFGVLAHVDAGAGFEAEMPGGSQHKIDVLCHPGLLGIELKQASSEIAYGPGDPDPNRVRMGQERIQRLGLGSKQNLARVLNSDAHALDALGRNAERARKVTRFKMDAPSFAALRIALEDADARVRIEDLVPQTVPMVLGIAIEGGFLKGQVIHFSPNLNCIIGGRGTGKSTAFETVRSLSGRRSESKVVDSEAWPDELHLYWQDEAVQRHCLYRARDRDIENIDDGEWRPRSFDIDCFSQGEAAKISLQAQSDPLALLRYLDDYVDVKDAIEEEDSARNSLLALQTEIEKAEIKVGLIPQYEQFLATTQRQLQALQKPDVKELIDLQRELATERALRGQIEAKLKDVKESLSLASQAATVSEIHDLAAPAELAVGGAEFRAILEGIEAFRLSISSAEAQVKTEMAKLERLVTAQMAAWKGKEFEVQKKIDGKRRELEALNVRFDMAYITKLATDEATHQTSVRNLNSWVPHLAEQRKRRAAALRGRWAARERVANLRDAFGRVATAKLREALADLHVSLKYQRNAYSPEANDQIIQAMGWRTNQQTRADWLVQDLTVPELLKAIDRRDPGPILGLRTPEGAEKFRGDEAQTIIERLSEPTVRYALQRVTLHDLPRLQVTRMTPDGRGGQRPLTREFAKLSLGQQQSVLLALILSSDARRPLIIDQPEDNLDGEFIYSTLVPVLRQAKERRQVIIVTHNPNVAILGDAEQIIVMKAMRDHGGIVARGSIDHPDTRDAACAILEGAREAFLRRAKVYGLHIR